MLLVDKYLLKQFLQTFAICFLSLFGLFMVIDAFGQLDDFRAVAEKQGSLFLVIGEYYGYRSLSFFDRTSGLITLMAAMFTISSFSRFNELTALLAAGVSKRRIVKPMIIASVIIAGIAAANREFVIPNVRDRFLMNVQDLSGEKGRKLDVPRYDNTTEILFRGAETFAVDQRVRAPSFRLAPPLDAHGNELVAANAFYKRANDQHPAGYLMQGVTSPRALLKQPSLTAKDNRPTILTPHDHSWLKADECFVVTDIAFEQLVGGSTWRDYASTWELISGVRNPSLGVGPDVRVAIHWRFLLPAMDMTLLFLGLPLVLSYGNRSIFAVIGQAVGLVAAFMVACFACQAMGGAYLISPVVAAWLPLLIFTPTAAMLCTPLVE